MLGFPKQEDSFPREEYVLSLLVLFWRGWV